MEREKRREETSMALSFFSFLQSSLSLSLCLFACFRFFFCLRGARMMGKKKRKEKNQKSRSARSSPMETKRNRHSILRIKISNIMVVRFMFFVFYTRDRSSLERVDAFIAFVLPSRRVRVCRGREIARKKKNRACDETCENVAAESNFQNARKKDWLGSRGG